MAPIEMSANACHNSLVLRNPYETGAYARSAKPPGADGISPGFDRTLGASGRPLLGQSASITLTASALQNPCA